MFGSPFLVAHGLSKANMMQGVLDARQFTAQALAIQAPHAEQPAPAGLLPGSNRPDKTVDVLSLRK